MSFPSHRSRVAFCADLKGRSGHKIVHCSSSRLSLGTYLLLRTPQGQALLSKLRLGTSTKKSNPPPQLTMNQGRDPRQHNDFGRCYIGHDLLSQDCQCDCPDCALKLAERPGRILWRIQNGVGFQPEPGPDNYVATHPALPAGLMLPNPPNPVDLAQRGQTREEFLQQSKERGEWREDQEEVSSEFPGSTGGHNAFTLELTQRPCTEMLPNPDPRDKRFEAELRRREKKARDWPWLADVQTWIAPCPNDRRAFGVQQGGEVRPYAGDVWPCLEDNCGAEEPGHPVNIYDHRGTLITDGTTSYEDDDDHQNLEDPPGAATSLNPEPNELRWVCQEHLEACKRFWEEENLLIAHWVPTCDRCRAHYQNLYPDGFNSCTCRNLFERWQCRRCYEKKVRHIQTRFRMRVMTNYTGEVVAPDDRRLIEPANFENGGTTRPGPGIGHYYKPYRRLKVRRMLTRVHPCINPGGFSATCGGKRGVRVAVQHCRSCAGVIVKPTVNPPPPAPLNLATRSTRRQRGGNAPVLQQLTFTNGRSGTGSRLGRASNQ